MPLIDYIKPNDHFELATHTIAGVRRLYAGHARTSTAHIAASPAHHAGTTAV